MNNQSKPEYEKPSAFLQICTAHITMKARRYNYAEYIERPSENAPGYEFDIYPISDLLSPSKRDGPT